MEDDVILNKATTLLTHTGTTGLKITSTQALRNDMTFKKLSTAKRITELKAEKERYAKQMGKAQLKQLNLELKKTQAEYEMILKTLKTTDYNRDENPATYTTDELTVARAIKNALLCMKLHQLFCENHNPRL